MAEEKKEKTEEKEKKAEEKEGKAVEKKEEKKVESKSEEKKAEEKKAEAKTESKGGVVLEREYIVPLRRSCKRVPEYKRVPRAIKTLRKFIVRHMKVPERDVWKVKIDKILNLELWFRGIRKPPAKIKIKAAKYSDGTVRVELSEVPEALKWKAQKEKKKAEAVQAAEEKKKEEEKKKAEQEEKKKEKGKGLEDKVSEKKKEKEKESSVAEQEEKLAKRQARQQKHAIMKKRGIKKPLARKALQK